MLEVLNFTKLYLGGIDLTVDDVKTIQILHHYDLVR